MATNNAAARESRRRKIVERGADRLAFITGRAQTLPSDPSERLNLDSCPPSNLLSDHQDPAPPPQHSLSSNQITVCNNNGSFGSMSPNDENDPTSDAGHGGSCVDPPLTKCETNLESLRPPASDELTTLATAVDQGSPMQTSGTEQLLEPQREAEMQIQIQLRQNRLLTPKQISSAITASEGSRLLSSGIIALLVLFSRSGFPLLGGNMIKNILSFRPLYLVLLTNITLVIMRLLFNNQSNERTIRSKNKIALPGKDDGLDQVGKALETALVMQKAVDAIFIDCSVYAIIVICGLTFI